MPAILFSFILGFTCASGTAQEQAPETADSDARISASISEFLNTHCIDCHVDSDGEGGFGLSEALESSLQDHLDVWEKVSRRVWTHQMPPSDVEAPESDERTAFLSELHELLDSHRNHTGPSVPHQSLRRLSRTEYRNSIRDLLGIEIDVSEWLPPDNEGHGFDNTQLTDLSPALMERYLIAAELISERVVGSPAAALTARTVRLPADLTQESHVEGLPLGTRGGTVVQHFFPRTGTYEIQIRLTRDRDEHVEGLNRDHELDVLLDGERLQRFELHKPASEKDHQFADRHLLFRFEVEAGTHDVGVTFVAQPRRILETKRQPLKSQFNRHRHPRQSPAIFEFSLVGISTDATSKFDNDPLWLGADIAELTPKAFEEKAKRRLRPLLRKAFRRAITDQDLERPLDYLREGLEDGSWEAARQQALASILVSPHFLFRIESADDTGHHDEFALASRLSFFLWSSLPDEELLSDAQAGRLSDPGIYRQHVFRMLRDDRAAALTENFAAQWLYLRNLDASHPDQRLYPDFDDNLRQAMRRETELLFAEMMSEDLSPLHLIQPGHTFVNERLAAHYGIPHVQGSRFRRVPKSLSPDRGGLLRHGSILTVTSYPTRTSPVLRGQWLLDNLLAAPVPPPPPNVPVLADQRISASLPIRERLKQHREDQACAACHRLIDPPGFSLETFDAIGQIRQRDFELAIDDRGGLPWRNDMQGVDDLEEAILADPERFLTALAEKLLTYALGRGLEPADASTVRSIVRSTRENDDRFSAMVVAIAESAPFLQKVKP